MQHQALKRATPKYLLIHYLKGYGYEYVYTEYYNMYSE